jgi:hypothetical protein
MTRCPSMPSLTAAAVIIIITTTTTTTTVSTAITPYVHEDGSVAVADDCKDQEQRPKERPKP